MNIVETVRQLAPTREDFTPKRVAIALGLSLATFLVFMAAKDIWFGEWRTYPARVTGHQFVPDRSYMETYTYDCGTNGKSRTCFGTRYVSIPAEYHVFVVEPDGSAHDMNDSRAFAAYQNGAQVRLKARVGVMTGWRWLLHIQR